jgi:hypothetical protein
VLAAPAELDQEIERDEARAARGHGVIRNAPANSFLEASDNRKPAARTPQRRAFGALVRPSNGVPLELALDSC